MKEPNEQSPDALREENDRLRQAYKYIHASRNSVDKELNEAQSENAALRSLLKELIPIVEHVVNGLILNNRLTEHVLMKQILDRAKLLILDGCKTSSSIDTTQKNGAGNTEQESPSADREAETQ
jgi:hypothetical protein